MKNFKKLLLPAILVFIVAAAFFIFRFRSSQDLPTTPQETSYATFKLSDQTYDISDYVSKTALEATQAKSTVVTSGTGTNAFVTTINGRTADPKKKEFWEFDVNGSEAQVGAGSYIIQNHDQIEWKITNF